jgi:hypothetical protein
MRRSVAALFSAKTLTLRTGAKIKAMTFRCTICEQESSRICVCCTKDTCDDHLCNLCKSCSDCCPHEVQLEQRPSVRSAIESAAQDSYK